VTSVSRRGECPLPGDKWLSQVDWQSGNALDETTITSFLASADAVVHCIGLLFDVESGLLNLNAFTSFSKSLPDDDSTYDNITRKSAMLVINALSKRAQLPEFRDLPPTPMAFMSAAEAGWPDVKYGDQVEALAPDWLKRYLAAKRAVEAELLKSPSIRSVIIRPSFIWNFAKLDALPLVPIFNIASFLGVPFVDKTVRVEDVGKAIVVGLLNENVQGVQRYMQIESLAAEIPIDEP